MPTTHERRPKISGICEKQRFQKRFCSANTISVHHFVVIIIIFSRKFTQKFRKHGRAHAPIRTTRTTDPSTLHRLRAGPRLSPFQRHFRGWPFAKQALADDLGTEGTKRKAAFGHCTSTMSRWEDVEVENGEPRAWMAGSRGRASGGGGGSDPLGSRRQLQTGRSWNLVEETEPNRQRTREKRAGAGMGRRKEWMGARGRRVNRYCRMLDRFVCCRLLPRTFSVHWPHKEVPIREKSCSRAARTRGEPQRKKVSRAAKGGQTERERGATRCKKGGGHRGVPPSAPSALIFLTETRFHTFYLCVSFFLWLVLGSNGM